MHAGQREDKQHSSCSFVDATRIDAIEFRIAIFFSSLEFNVFFFFFCFSVLVSHPSALVAVPAFNIVGGSGT